jgi:hypothetical protein
MDVLTLKLTVMMIMTALSILAPKPLDATILL